MAGVAAGLFLAFSYTFWTQAITAEVYTLHLLIAGLGLAGALRVGANSRHCPRLALFYAIYALGFGNHLSMILLLPGFALFLLMQRRRHGRRSAAPRPLAMAVAIAAVGALQYLWNFRGLWPSPTPPASVTEAIGEILVRRDESRLARDARDGRVRSGSSEPPGDVLVRSAAAVRRAGVLLAVDRIRLLARALAATRNPPVACCTSRDLVFAWTYNVGDAYIFFLPSHYIVALCAGAGVARSDMAGAFSRPLPSALCPAHWRRCACSTPPGAATTPSPPSIAAGTTRAVQVLDRLTAPPLRGRKWFCADAIFGVDANWQVQNAVEYYMREHKPGGVVHHR